MPRQSNIELIRILAMIFIVAHHIVMHVFNFVSMKDEDFVVSDIQLDTLGRNIGLFVNAFCIIGVNLFVLITGYFSINLKWKSLLNIFWLMFFYILIDLVVSHTFAIPIAKSKVIGLFGLGNFSGYWFMEAYILLMIFSPLINRLIEVMSARDLSVATGILVFASCVCGWVFRNRYIVEGYNVHWMITLYFIGAWIRENADPERLRGKWLALCYITSTVLIGAFAMFFFTRHPSVSWGFFNYNSPFVVVSSVCVFLLFLRFKFHSPLINKIAASVIAIYLVQESAYGFYIYKVLRAKVTSGSDMLPIISQYLLVVLIAPILIDQLRIWIFGKTLKPLSDTIERRYPLPSVRGKKIEMPQ